MNNACNCSEDPEGWFDEDTSSLEDEFSPMNITNLIGHRLSSQESASKAFDTLGLVREKQNGQKEMDSRSN